MSEQMTATLLDNDDNKLIRNGSDLTIDVRTEYYNYYQVAPSCFNASTFMLPIDVNKVSPDTVRFSSHLSVNQESLSNLKDQIIADTNGEETFVNQCVDLILAPLLQMFYAQTENKTWDAPLHPDNIFIDNDTNLAKSMLRYPENLQMSDEVLEDLQKIILWSLFPVSSQQFSYVFSSKPFVTLTSDNFYEWIKNQSEDLMHYTRTETILSVESLLDSLNDAFEENQDVRDMLELLNKSELIREVDDMESAIDIDTPSAPVAEEPTAEDEDFEDEEEPVEEEPVKQPQPKKNKPRKKGGKGKLLLGVGVLALLGAGGAYSMMHHSQNNSTKNTPKTTVTSSQTPQTKQDANKNSTFYHGTLACTNGQYSEAVSDFQSFLTDSSNKQKYYMTKDEKVTVYVAYSKVDKYQQLLKDMTPFDSKTPVTLTNYLLLENQRPQILKLQSDSKYINFAKAYINGDNAKMVKYANSDLVTNQQMAVACGKAFGTLKKISEAKEWLQTLNNQNVQQQATMAVIDGANNVGMNPDDVKKQLNVSD